MIVIGLTGSIAMGKSTTARMFRCFGAVLFDSDATVHALMAPGGAGVDPIRRRFGAVVRADGGIDRGLLGREVLREGGALAELEAILHPLVGKQQRRFLATLRRQNAHLALLDVPLLFETGGDRRCDVTVVASAPAWLQAQRVLSRPGMTQAKLEAIRARQMPDPEKRRRADFSVFTGCGRGPAFAQVAAIAARLSDRVGSAWPDRW
ncbi:MAG: dephospho-CoA kinase [Geminicoccaceae bacterium]